jgi:hypothetical protein
LILSSQSAL